MNRKLWLPVLVGSLGYFVDIYDLVLFSIVRVASLKDLGVPDSEILNTGVTLLNSQMSGMLVGGILWGIWGDKKGRLSVLFGSIFLYSLANIANGFAHSIPAYAVLRFIAGVGLAGELGAAITLVSEILPQSKRGYGTAIVAGVGLSGAVVAGMTAEWVSWRASYFIGGGLGLLLLFLRLGVLESGLFLSAKNETHVRRGDLRLLFFSKDRVFKYLSCILIAVPIWYVVGILMTFSPEIGLELGTTEPLVAGKAIMFCYAGVAVGDLLTGFISQWIKSRKKVVLAAMSVEAVFIAIILFLRGYSADTFYTLAFLIGTATGYWAVFMTLTAEQFGTNLRSTVTTSVPNIVRGSVVLMTLSFRSLSNHFSLVQSALFVGVVVLIFGYFALAYLEETYHKDLNYLEH